MADVHKVVFYPVGNGDTTQIVLSGGRRVLFDFGHRDRAEDTDTPEIDLKSRLKDELKAVDRDYFDVVAFTHADLDHVQGSTAFFELQHAKKYQGEGRIKIWELWVPAAMPTRTISRKSLYCSGKRRDTAYWKARTSLCSRSRRRSPIGSNLD